LSEGSGHPWVESFRGKIGLGLQLVAARSEGDASSAIIRGGLHAEKYGYDAVFLGDHPAWAPDCWLHLGVLATTTERVRLGQMVAALPYRNPLVTARLQADLDRLSHGRSILGLGIGWNASDYGLGENEFYRMGIPYPPVAQRQEALEEGIAIIRGLWEPEPLNFEGKYYSATNASVDPPAQPGGVPLIVAGGGTRTLDQLARLGDIANFGPGPAGNVDSAATASDRLQMLRDRCQEHGRDLDTILRSLFTHWVILAPTQEAVDAKVRRYFPDGLDPFWGAYLVAGTPQRIAETFQEYVDVGINFIDIQTLDPDDEETIALVTTDLAPLLTPLPV